jgi:hypothetical protein
VVKFSLLPLYLFEPPEYVKSRANYDLRYDNLIVPFSFLKVFRSSSSLDCLKNNVIRRLDASICNPL